MGNIIVQKPSSDFEMVPRDLIRTGDTLSLGVYVKLLCFGGDWEMNVKGLSKTLGVSIDKTRSAITFLEKEGFIIRTPRRTEDNAKLSGWEYIVKGVRVENEERTCAGSSVSQNQTSLKPVLSESDQDNINRVEYNNIPPMCISSISHTSDINIPSIQNTTHTLSPKGEDVCLDGFPVWGNGEKHKSTPKAPSFTESVERIYAAYPSRDKATADYPKGRSLGKCSKDKLKIERCLKNGEYTEEQLIRAIEFCIEEHPRGYMPNFGTFLNNIPDIPDAPQPKVEEKEEEIDWNERFRQKNEWYANGAREEDMPRWIREIREK